MIGELWPPLGIMMPYLVNNTVRQKKEKKSQQLSKSEWEQEKRTSYTVPFLLQVGVDK